jgi:hypothetical protein
LKPSFADVDDLLRCFTCFFAKNVANDNGVGIKPVDNPPSHFGIVNAKFMTPWSDDKNQVGQKRQRCPTVPRSA